MPRKLSKSDGKILTEYLYLIFFHNHACSPEDRYDDSDIRSMVAYEFGNSIYNDPKKNYVSVWRNMFNTGRIRTPDKQRPAFLAFRVNVNKQFTRRISPESYLTIQELHDEYKKHNLIPKPSLVEEVKSYAT